MGYTYVAVTLDATGRGNLGFSQSDHADEGTMRNEVVEGLSLFLSRKSNSAPETIAGRPHGAREPRMGRSVLLQRNDRLHGNSALCGPRVAVTLCRVPVRGTSQTLTNAAYCTLFLWNTRKQTETHTMRLGICQQLTSRTFGRTLERRDEGTR